MVFIPALLLFTTLTSVGLAAAWAATSRWHWFVRTMLFLGVAALPLVIPAYEMFVAFVLQGLVVAVGVQAWRWRRRDVTAGKGSRVALRDALLVVVPAATLLGAGSQFSFTESSEWLSPLLVGPISGLAVLLGLRAASAGGRHPLKWLLPVSAMAAILAVPLALFERNYPSFWDLIEMTFLFGDTISSPLNLYTDTIDFYGDWMLAIACLTAVVAVVGLLYRSGVAAAHKKDHSKSHRIAWSPALVAFVGLAALPTLTLVRLANPIAIPDYHAPEPNGFDDYLKAIAALPPNPKIANLVFDLESATLPQLTTAVQEVSTSLAHVTDGLLKDLWRTPTYTLGDLDTPDAGSLRALGGSLVARGLAAAKRGDFAQAANDELECIAFGVSLSRGGLMIDSLIGLAISGMGMEALYELSPALPLQERAKVITRLRTAENRLDSFENIVLRDKIWSQRAFGWVGMLAEQLSYLQQEEGWAAATFATSYKRQVATIRLLQLEYAVLLYQDQHGELPGTLNQLTPSILPTVPADPFSPDGAIFRYRHTGDQHLLYSVWADGIDHEGAPPAEDSGVIMWGADNLGDLSLAALYDVDPHGSTTPLETDEQPLTP